MKSRSRKSHAHFCRLKVGSTLLALVCFLLPNNSLRAQPVPKLNSISPEWVQRGANVDIVLSGENLSQISEFVFSGDEHLTAVIAPPTKPNVRLEAKNENVFSTSATDDKRVTARLSVAAETTLGTRELRVVTQGGISNPLTIHVTDTPEISEAGGKHSGLRTEIAYEVG